MRMVMADGQRTILAFLIAVTKRSGLQKGVDVLIGVFAEGASFIEGVTGLVQRGHFHPAGDEDLSRKRKSSSSK